jgi:PAS domain S-box-containing protein
MDERDAVIADLRGELAALRQREHDLIERMRSLAESEESGRLLAEAAPEGIVSINPAGAILFANAAAARIFGYGAHELIGMDFSVIVPERPRALHSGDDDQRLGTAGLHRAGYEIPIEISLRECERPEGRFLVGVIRDATERNRLDEALRQTTKLESLGVLAGGIAHDFNNLLTGILGNVSLAVDLVDEANPARPLLQDAIDASERAANLTSQLLAYAGKGRFVIQPIDLSALVRETAALIRSSIPKHVTLRLDLEEPLPPVDADVAQLQQLIMNLVLNGVEAIPEDREGTVLVITRTREVDARYLADLGIAEIAPGRYVALNVHDNGTGMDAATLTRIYDPFFTTKFTGRGLGLAAAGGIVRGHKGALKVFSSPGQGTTFKALLPAAATVPAAHAEEDARGSEFPAGGLVLVIDDESIVRRVAASGLKKYGYAVVTAENGREGVERFRALHAELKLVILDMTMPVMSGEEALDLIRGINPGVPVILSSGHSETEAVRRFAGKGLAGFLQKPYTAAGLAEKVQSVLRAAQNSTSNRRRQTMSSEFGFESAEPRDSS